MNSNPKQPYLSLVIPVYYGKTIRSDVAKIATVCKKIGKPFEIICVVDGLKNSEDNTLKEVQKIKESFFSFHFLEQNKGKGYAVRFGLNKARGKFQGFIDAGHDIEPDGILTALKLLQKHQVDGAIGNKKNIHSSIKYPLTRRIYTKTLQKVIKIFLNLPYEDTQVGLKIFTNTLVQTLLPQLTVNRWAFDLELLALAHKQGYKNIQQFPITITYNYSTTIKTTDLIHFLREFVLICWRIRTS